MAEIVYYVASSLDGFISGEDGDISGFAQGGPCVEQYFQDLLEFKTVIMGRKTYEFGYQYGLKEGQPAYPHMKHYIFSDTLGFENPHENVRVEKLTLDRIMEIKERSESNIYLCGGGTFAGWLLSKGLIDKVRIKLNPIILNGGVRLFEGGDNSHHLQLIDKKSFEDGLQLLTYKINI